ncbi:hypothetical protein FHEFKHOI_00379 [Candidatus Methanoperedenaceae archaeon GB50]|nr:hypothetical protein AIOGIFDO_00377 [Candidatus Methanoperedenaceae archaeon GB37]CAD7768674.1 hypothetical protein FHEFKHOI_00379 [Candidatus Methanoperedenaceae archaeon GB50]CAD7779469.1 MAG: hypothetical protein KBONHNOK_01305 [Candidatus Methanoperedenaceae archaeon GB50]
MEPQDIKPEITDPLVKKAVSLPDEKILFVGEVFNTDFEPHKGTFEWHNCDKCGEAVFAIGLRIVNGKYLCMPCSGYE